jgi:hypothetical protein
MGRGVRRTVGGLVTLALVAAAIGFYLVSPRLSATSGLSPGTNAEPTAVRSSSQSADPGPNPTLVPSETATQAPGSSPDPNLPPGPGGREPGIRLTATPTSQGLFDVVETVRLVEPVTKLTLAPPDLTSASPSLRGMRPVAEGLVVTAGDSRIKLPSGTVRRATVIRLTTPAYLFELRYQLRGTIVVSKPSTLGRRLGGLGPLVTGVPDGLAVAISVRGHSVRNLSCPRLPQDDQACAAGQQPRLRVNRNLARRDALVEVQFDITAAQVEAPR